MADEASTGIFIGSAPGGARPQYLELSRANRHGLIAGATGTGKTVTLQGLVEGLSAAGVPTFLADVKGDLAGLAMPGSALSKAHEAFAKRASDVGMVGWQCRGVPVQLWDLFGTQGHPIRTTISEMGPLLLARLMDLNQVQEGVLAIAFHVADKEALPLLDLDDLQAMLVAVGERAEELTLTYGNVSKPSVGAIQRSVLQLRAQGADHFFGEPALDLADLMRTEEEGAGVVNILAADRLMASPRLYSTFLLWLLSELFEELPEVGDQAKPKLCFFFDEAHLLFDDAPRALVDKVEQVVRLIRSKGVGVYFITQNPIDIPDTVAGQLGNRLQHALRAFTPRDQAAVKSAAETFRQNPEVDVESAITELKVGEALVSVLMPDGAPTPVERVLIKPPSSRVGPLTGEERQHLVSTDSVSSKYDQALDRESAQELLSQKLARTTLEREAAEKAKADAAAESDLLRTQREREKLAAQRQRNGQRETTRREREEQRKRSRREREAARPTTADKMLQSAGRAVASSLGRQIGNQLLRGIFGGLVRGR
jgi:DNA helicase HerA-like ATPase